MPTTDLTRTIGQLYRMVDADRERLAEQLLDARKRAWDAALRAVADEHGCQQSPTAPRREDLDELKRQSIEDANSIADTWNFDVDVKIEALFAANPRGNRFYYTSHLERWDKQRQAWKLPQIALATDTTTTAYARQRFYAQNGLRGGQYIFVGSTPVCEVCISMFAEGVVDQEFVDKHPNPQHVNCDHQWKMVNPERVNCSEIWLG